MDNTTSEKSHVDEIATIVQRLEQLGFSRTNMLSPQTPRATSAHPGMTSNCLASKSFWIVDSGATDHMTGNNNLLSRLAPTTQPPVQIANGSTCKVEGIGSAQISPHMSLSSVLYVPSFPENLLSVTKLIDQLYCSVTFTSTKCVFQELGTNKLIGTAYKYNGLYYMESSPQRVAYKSTSSAQEVHYQLGHPSLQVETLSREDLASRLTLNVDAASVGTLLLSDSFITLMDTNDYCAIPQHLKDEVSDRYPEARRAHLKNGGDFPFLSRPDEVILHLQLHLRRVSVEAKPELVRGAKPPSSSSIQTETSYMSHESEDQHKNDSGERASTSSDRNDEGSKEAKVEEPSLTATTSYGSDESEEGNTNDNGDQRLSSAASDSKNNNDLIEELYDPSYDDIPPTPLALAAESETHDDLEENTVVDPDSPQESEPKLLL